MTKRIANATTGTSYRFDGAALDTLIIDPQIARWEDFNEESVTEKVEQFQTIGQETPILIRLVNKEVCVVDGRNRLEAAKRVHTIQEAEDIPAKQRFRLWAVERVLDDREALIASLAANRTRPTTVVDLASAASKLSNQDLGQKQVSEIFYSTGIKISQSRVSQLLKIHTQPFEIKQMLARGQLSESDLKVLMATVEAGNLSTAEMPKVANKIITGQVSIPKLRRALDAKAREKGKRRTRSIGDLLTFLKAKDTEKAHMLGAWMSCEMTDDDPPQELVSASDMSRLFDD